MTHIAPPPPDRDTTLLGYAPMDEIHHEFETLIAQALSCRDAELPGLLEQLQQHLQSHFAAEDQWMHETDFPARDCHIEEHAAVLRSAEEVCEIVSAGNLALGRAFVAEIDKWFPAHADYLDSALATWMCKRRFGGAPMVLHRKPVEA